MLLSIQMDLSPQNGLFVAQCILGLFGGVLPSLLLVKRIQVCLGFHSWWCCLAPPSSHATHTCAVVESKAEPGPGPVFSYCKQGKPCFRRHQDDMISFDKVFPYTFISRHFLITTWMFHDTDKSVFFVHII